MKKFVLILIGIFAFSIGFWVYQSQNTDRLISMCEISKDYKSYDSQRFRIRTVLAMGGYYDVINSKVNITDYKEGCASVDNVELSDGLKNNPAFSDLTDELFEKMRNSQKGMNDGWAVVEVELEGIIALERVRKDRFKFKATNFQQISQISFVSDEQAESLYTDLRIH
ncbi:MAG: hypothetical protein ABIP06_07150 [Pyrinomonadaceae bacterium]